MEIYMLCDYGCGRNSIVLFKNGKNCCAKRSDQCPEIIRKRVETRRNNGDWHSAEARLAIGISAKGRILSAEWRDKISESSKGRIVTDITKEKISAAKTGVKTDRPAWNSGSTTETDDRILSYSLKQKDKKCPARSHPNKNKGHKKTESLEILSRDDPAYSNFRKYRNRVAVRTKKNYDLYKHEINPLNLPIGKCGVDGAYQIDHKISVRAGFEQGMLIEYISSKENLQMLPWLDNVIKYDGKGTRKWNK